MAESRNEIVPVATGLISAEQQRAIAEVQTRMIMARAQPRNQERAFELILKDCERLSLAENAVYQFARGGNDIRGPSIRLLEAIATRWQNIASGIKILDRQDGYTECASYAWDLENNHYDERQFRVSHMRNTRRGSYRLTDERDIYEAEANAGQRRKRAALEAVIPRDVVEAAVERCEQTVASKADTSPEGIAKMLEAFAQLGVTKEQIEVRIQRRINTISPVQVIGLKRIYTSLRDGMSVPSDWFEMPQQQQPATGNEALRQRLAPQSPTKPQERDPAAEPPEHIIGEDGVPAAPRQAVTPPHTTPPESAPDELIKLVDEVVNLASYDRAQTSPGRPREVGEEQPPASPEGAALAGGGGPEGDAPIEVIKPVRLRRGGWDWQRYADEYVGLGTTLPRARLGEFRAKQAPMFDALRTSDKELWSHVNQELANYERGLREEET